MCFADGNSLPWSLPTIFHPDLIATQYRRDSFFKILRTALTAILVSDLRGVDVK